MDHVTAGSRAARIALAALTAALTGVTVARATPVRGGTTADAPSGWRATAKPPYGLKGLACRSTSSGLALLNGTVVAWDGDESSTPSTQLGDGFISGPLMRCIGTSRCVVVDGEKAWWTL